MTAETSNARLEVVAERQAWYEQQIALAEGQWAAAFLDRWECGDDVPSKEHYVALWLAERAAPQPADAEPKTLPVPTRVYLTDRAAVIVGDPQRGWGEEGPEAHNCDDMGCSTIGPHVLARVPFTDERSLTAAQQQGQAAAECHCATCTCAPDMTPAVRFDTSPAAQEGVVRDHLIALGWTPPGAQQPAATAAKDAEIEALRAEVERLTFEMERLQQQYDERTACMIVHRGSALACSDAVRAAYSDEHHRAERLAEALRAAWLDLEQGIDQRIVIAAIRAALSTNAAQENNDA